MIRKSEECAVRVSEAMRGGPGSAVIKEFASQDEMLGSVRLFEKITLKPGSGIGYHVHNGEGEIFMILSGTALYNDNSEEVVVHAGDVTILGDGEGHAITNIGDEDVEIIAMIPLNKQ